MGIFGKPHKNEVNIRRIMDLAPGVSMEFMQIPAGIFLMGAKKGDKWSEPDQQPQHKVYLDEYYLGRTPVTNKQYNAYVSETGCAHPEHWKGGKIPYAAENHPVYFCSWADAVSFCDWASIKTGFHIRLPSEAEWEKAARGTDGRIYPWGNQYDWEKGNREIMHASWSQRKDVLGVYEVGKYPERASPYGCDDMAGSMDEWVSDWYDPKYYLTSPERNPVGPPTGTQRVLRNGVRPSQGGGLMRSARRNKDFPDSRIWGFRCALSPKKE